MTYVYVVEHEVRYESTRVVGVCSGMGKGLSLARSEAKSLGYPSVAWRNQKDHTKVSEVFGQEHILSVTRFEVDAS